MTIISNIIFKDKIKIDSSLNIIWTPIDNTFDKFIKYIGHSLLNINDLYFGDIIPNLIICNNKVSYYEQVQNLSIRLHIPVLVVDHTVKNDMLDQNKLHDLNNFFSCSYHIATNNDVHNSWLKYHDQVLHFDINNHNNQNTWKNLLYQLSKKVFTIS